MKKIILFICMALFAFVGFTEYASASQETDLRFKIKKAEKLMAKGSYEDALPLILDALRTNPGNKDALKLRLTYERQVIEPFCKSGAIAYFDNDYSVASSSWRKVLNLNPLDIRAEKLLELIVAKSDRKSLEAMYRRADNLAENSKLMEARDEIEKILSLYPYEERARGMLLNINSTLSNTVLKDRYDKAHELAQEKKFDQAIAELMEIINIDPKQELARKQIASIHRMRIEDRYNQADKAIKSGAFTMAKSLYVQIAKENSSDLQALETSKRLDAVTRALPEIKDNSKVSLLLIKSISNFVLEQGDPKVAVAASWYATQLDPENNTAKIVRDFIETRSPLGVKYLDPPTKNMNIVEQYLFASLNHIYDGRYDFAVTKSSVVLELEPDNLLAMKRLGSAYFLMGQKKKAGDVWRRALKKAPNDNELREFISQLSR